MFDRVKVYPPGGGDPVEVYELDAPRLVLNGWSLNDPSAPRQKPAAKQSRTKPQSEETVTDEGLTDGNT